MRGFRVLPAAVVGGLLLTACATAPGSSTAPGPSATPAVTATATSAATAGPGPGAGAVDPAAVAANELGQVPVLMYHQILANPKRVYDWTPAQFRAQLQLFYDEDYRPVTASDLVAGKIDIPAGKHAVVLTFDDSTISQAQIGADGAPTANSALGILEAFGREHPDFKPTATFYVNTVPEPFVDAKVLPWLAARGYEIGAHTRTHADLRKLSDAGVQQEIGGNIAEIQAAVPGYTVTTMALPFGTWPVNRALTHQGAYLGTSYNLAGVVIVDVIPALSPYATTFNPYRISRIGSQDSAVALDSLEKYPSHRYTSDGDPNRISFPAAQADTLAPAWTDKARPY